ncbi:MAG: hypothetical protein AB1810_09760 [Pseudomonadota bacterium]
MDISLSDIAALVKNVGAVVGSIAYLVKQWKFPAQSLKRRSKDIESLQFIQEQLAFPLRRRHRLPVEQAFSIYFKRRISYDVAVAILRLRNPLTAFKLYFSGRDYLEYNKDSDSFDFKAKFKEQDARQFRKRHFIAWYFVFALSGMYLLMYSADILKVVGIAVLPGLVVLIASMLSLAYVFVDGSASVSAAERFIEESKYLAPDS